MRCTGYTTKNEPCQNKVREAGGKCHIHEGGLTLLTYDLDRIQENEPFELRQGGRTYYISIDVNFRDLISEVKNLTDENKKLNIQMAELNVQYQTVIDDYDELERHIKKTMDSLTHKVKYSISYDRIIRDVKAETGLNLDVTNQTTQEIQRYKINTHENIVGLYREIADRGETIKKLNSELEKIKRRPAKSKPNDNYKIIKRENDDLRESVRTLKERVAAHSAISKICYSYELFDAFINETVEKITNYKRDYGAGIYNKITDFMRIRNINKICLDNLSISSAEFYEIFNNLRDTRNETCHPRLKKRDSKNITSAVNHYLT